MVSEKILSFKCGNSKAGINNASAVAITYAQKAFEGAAQEFGVTSDEDVQRLIDEVRYQKTGAP